VGLDPEVFITSSKGEVIAGERLGYPPASKKGENGRPESLVYDNAAVEFRTTGRSCLEGLHNEVWTSLLRIAKRAASHTPAGKISLSPCLPLSDKDAALDSVMEFGCSPALRVDALGEIETVEPLIDPYMSPLRSAGYHIHIGGLGFQSPRAGLRWNETPSTAAMNTSSYPWGQTSWAPVRIYRDSRFRKKFIERAITFMDAFIGLPGTVFESMDGGKAAWDRRNVLGYGRAGEFRYTGRNARLEYRVLSPWPLCHPVWSWWACSMARNAVHMALGDWKANAIELPDRAAIMDAINAIAA